MKLKQDAQIAKLFRETREWLRENKPVKAMESLKALEARIYGDYVETKK